MIYREFLVMRKALAWFAGVLSSIMLLAFVTMHKGHGNTDLGGIAVTSGWLAAIFGSIFGVALGNGSREPARVLWVLPQARWKTALETMAIDLIGSTVAFGCAFGVILLFVEGAQLRESAGISGTIDPRLIVMGLALVYATYAWSALLGMLGRRVAYFGIVSLPLLMTWMILGQLEGTIGEVARVPIAANPLAVFNVALVMNTWAHHHSRLDPTTSSLQWMGTTWELPILVAIVVASGALAVTLWQRAQAISA